MNDADLKEQRIQPLDKTDLGNAPELDQLFMDYPFKDFQLKQLGIPKKNMLAYLKIGLKDDDVQSACLIEDGRLVGLISVRYLPWLSEHFEARMFSLQHLLTSGKEPGYYQNMIRYLVDQIAGIDFLDCRVAAGDINAIQALENSGFRFVGNEVYLIRALVENPVDESYRHPDCIRCPRELQPQVFELATRIHFHNRYMYDPEVAPKEAKAIYHRYLSGMAFNSDYHCLVKLHRDRLQGFIFYKINQRLSEMVDGRHASLDFIGVDHGIQNEGLGNVLNRAALWHLAQIGATHVVVRTLGSNYPAIRICHKVGFKITSSDLHFHHWLRPKAREKTASQPPGIIIP
jgi:ribosomal protein S18 acetylase RimI-like enzyme